MNQFPGAVINHVSDDSAGCADAIRNWRALLTAQPRVLAAELLNSGATSLMMCFLPLTRGVALHAANTLPSNEVLGLLLLISLRFTSGVHSQSRCIDCLLAFPLQLNPHLLMSCKKITSLNIPLLLFFFLSLLVTTEKDSRFEQGARRIIAVD